MLLWNPVQVLLILKVLSTSVRIKPNLLEKGEKLRKQSYLFDNFKKIDELNRSKNGLLIKLC